MPVQFVPVVTVGRSGSILLESEIGHTAGPVAMYLNGTVVFGTNTTVQRWRADGTPDTSFGLNGYVLLPRGSVPNMYPEYYGPTVLDSGKILVTGAFYGNGDTSVTLLRLNADGSTDTSFGSAGKVVSMLDPTTNITVFATTVLADGKILVATNDWAKDSDGGSGSAEATHIGLARYLPNGVLDTSFGVKGFALDSANLRGLDVQIQADGKIVVPGWQRDDHAFSVVRFNADGSRDTQFGNNGMVMPLQRSQGYNDGLAKAVAIQPDGKLIVVGQESFGNYPAVTVVRLNPDGSLDTSFAEKGLLYLDTIPGYGEAVHLNADGSILVGVNMWDWGQGIAVLRLRSNGQLDTTFGENGFARVAPSEGQRESFEDMSVSADGHILLTSDFGKPPSSGAPIPKLTVFDADGHLDTSFGQTAAVTSNSASYTQGYLDQFLNPHLHLETPAGQESYDGLVVTLARSGGANAADHFTAGDGVSFVNGALVVNGVTIGSATQGGGSLKLAFNANATPALTDLALQGIGYQHSGTYAEGDHVTIAWKFSTSGGSTQVATEVTLHQTGLPYWIDTLLDRSYQGQSAQDLRDELASLLNGKALTLQFAADLGAAQFTAAEQAVIGSALDKLAEIVNLRPGTGGTAVVAHHSAQLQAGESASMDLAQGRGDIFFSGSPELAAVLHSLGQMLGLQGAGADLGVLETAALQYLYGPSQTARAGNDTYVLSADSSNFIWDGAGKDTISAAGLSRDVTLHLEAGHWDYIGAQGSTITAAGQVTVNYGSTIENAIGGSGNDQLTGNSAANALSGGSGNDVLAGLGGNDVLDGGAGIDTAVFTGKAASYVVRRTASGWDVSDNRSQDGIDHLTGVERLQFSDKFLALGDDAAQVYRLYQAAFNRTPDAAGFGYWLQVQDAGSSLRDIATGFESGAEFKKLYSGATEEAFVTQLYQNVLHRAPDAAGLAYWVGHLKTDTTRLDVLLGFSESKENIAALVGVTDTGMAYVPYH